MESNQEKIEVKHTSNHDELLEISKETAKKIRELKELEDEKKAINSQFKAKIDMVQADINLHSQWTNNGYKYKMVTCNVVKDTTLRVLSFYSIETGELVQQRRMTEEQYQLTINDLLIRNEQ